MTEDQRDTRQRLLHAATDLFAQNGYDGASIRDIAAAADVNVAAVNYHFQGKENLYREVLKFVIQGKRDRYMAALEQVQAQRPGDMEAIIRAFFWMHFEDTLKTPAGSHFIRLFVRELHHGQPDTVQLIADLMIPLWQDLGQQLIAACPEINTDIIPWIAGSLHGQMVHFTMRWHQSHCGMHCPQTSNAVARIFPPLADNVDDYIDLATDHITRFSVAGIHACIEAHQDHQDEGDTP